MHPRCSTAIFALALALMGSVAHAADYTAGSLHVRHPWSRATPNGAKVAAGYLTIDNQGSAPDRLLGGSAPEVASRIEVHQMSTEGGVMKMHPVEGGLEIKPGASVTLAPGGYHLMLMDLKRPLAPGDEVKGALTFEHAGTVPIAFEVQSIGAPAPSPGGPAH